QIQRPGQPAGTYPGVILNPDGTTTEKPLPQVPLATLLNTLLCAVDVLTQIWSGQVPMDVIFAGVDRNYNKANQKDVLKALEMGQQIQRPGQPAGTYPGVILNPDGTTTEKP